MDKIIVDGGKRLNGSTKIKSAKNSVLALMAASILTGGEVVLKDCPQISDLINMASILRQLGCKVEFNGDTVTIDSSTLNSHELSKELANKMRASVFLLGSLLGRTAKAKAVYPGGCNIGMRPIDLHLKGLKELNVLITEEDGYIICDGRAMCGGEVFFDYPSVGATENVMMAAAFIKGDTVIHNAAREPEIVDLADFLNKAGAKIKGAGSSKICIEGKKVKSKAIEYTPIPDRITAGTILLGGLCTGCDIEICNCPHRYLQALLSKLKYNACKIVPDGDKMYVKSNTRLNGIDLIETMPYPGFPTDLQAPIMPLCAISKGTSIIIESMFDARYKHVSELTRMGADITVRERMAVVRGVKKLHGACVTAADLRGGAALVVAGLAAEGKTQISGCEHIDRGYYQIEQVFAALGADIKREK